VPLTDEGRRKAGRTRALRAKLAKSVRVVPLDQVPPLATLDDAVTASAWLFRMGTSGTLDPATVREANRSVTTFKDALNKRDLLVRIRNLEKELKAYQQRSATR
jgi:hypothetical protein